MLPFLLLAILGVPGDHPTIQEALDAAGSGDEVVVSEAGGPYFERVVFPRSGSEVGGYITLRSAGGERAVIDGSGVAGDHLVTITSKSWVRIQGFELRNNLGVNDGSAVRVEGSGSHIEIRDNVMHELRGSHAMGITVYGTGSDPITDLVIDGNEIFDAEPRFSEALTLNGNVDGWEVTNNFVHDVNYIGIDMIGGEADIQPEAAQGKVARNGVVRGNTVRRARDPGDGFAGGIYVDGGRDILIENNIVSESNLGIEIGAENAGLITSGIIVRNNLLHENDRVCIVFGGYRQNVGRSNDNEFRGNTCWHNDQLGEGFGELWIQFGDDNVIEGNLFVATPEQGRLLNDEYGGQNQIDWNTWHTTAASPEWVWNGDPAADFAAFQAASGQGANGQFADPGLVDPANGDFHLGLGSPAVDAGNPAYAPAAGEVDLDGNPRRSGAAVDAGVDESTDCGDGVVQPGEDCDDGNTTDCDGCDTDCTLSATCGNGIVCAAEGEQCDDGASASGDCCTASCQLEPEGSACDDGVACSTGDACDDAGVCASAPAPEPEGVCLAPTQPGKASLTLKDKSNDSKDAFTWSWKKGEATSLADFGQPAAATGFDLCLYDEGGLLWSSRAPGGGAWKATGTKGFKYKAPSKGDPVRSVKLKAGETGKASIQWQGKGSSLGLPPLPPTGTAVVQLRADSGVCWEARYTTPRKATTELYKAKSD
jgi:cysteine-rich repeat protein